MSSVQSLREFVTERLTAAAAEIFGVFEKTIVEYEEEIDRQRRLLDMVWKPEIKLHRLELPQQHVCKEEKVLTNEQLCNQERNSSLDQDDPDPPQIKENQEELCTSHEGERLALKQETDNVMLISAYGESDHTEPEPISDQQLLSHSSTVAESQDQEGSKHVDSGSTRKAERNLKKMHHKSISHLNNVDISPMSETHCDTHIDERTFKCDTCGKAFKHRYILKRHLRTHTGEKPYVCNTCEKRFSQSSDLKIHSRLHTDEKPYSCQTCGRAFRLRDHLTMHMIRVHKSEAPYFCNTCGKIYLKKYLLVMHMRIHTGEKPYNCNTCGKRFIYKTDLVRHKRIHTGERPVSL